MALAWTGPGASPPSGNVSAPINVGSVDQVKNANIGVNGLAVFGNSLLQTSSYLNWGVTAGTTGYGIWDNAGTLNFKNSGGSWQSLQAIVSALAGASQWTTSGTNIYNSNAGNVGIGAATPGYKLDVNGQVNAASASGAGGYVSTGNYGGTGSAAFFPQGIYSNGATAWINGTITTNGAFSDSAVGTIRDAGGGWVRTYGNTGWVSQTWGGGWYMSDLTWIRAYGGKSVYTAGTVRGDAGLCIGTDCRTSWPTGGLAAEADTLATVTARGASTASTLTVPVISDYNNSGYYLDPNSTSRLNYGIFDQIYSYGWLQGSIFYDSNNGAYYLDPAGTSNLNGVYASQYLYSSDERLKEHIKPIYNSLWKVLQLKGVSFNWNSGARKGQADIGVIAQDVEKVLPEAVHTDEKTGMLSVDYPRLVPLLINAIKEQKDEIEKLTKRIDALEAHGK